MLEIITNLYPEETKWYKLTIPGGPDEHQAFPYPDHSSDPLQQDSDQQDSKRKKKDNVTRRNSLNPPALLLPMQT